MVLVGKLLIGLTGAIAGVFLLGWYDRVRPTSAQFKPVLYSIFLLSRFAIYGVLFIGIGVPAQSDVTVYYRDAKQALAGHLPFLEFETFYGPLFPYLAALPVLLWDSPASIVLLSVLIEICSLPLWLSVGRTVFGEERTHRAAILYVCSPIALANVPITGQNHIWISLFLAISFVFLIRNADFLSGFFLGVSVIAVKFLSLIFLPALYLAAGRRGRYLLGCALVPAICYAALALAGADLLEQVRYHAFYNSSGNLPYFLGVAGLSFSSVWSRTAVNGAGLLIIGFVLFAVAFRATARGHKLGLLLCPLITLLVLLISKKSFASYLLTCLFPLSLCVADLRCRSWTSAGYGVFGALVALEPSLWFRWLNQGELSLLWCADLPAGIQRPRVLLFLLCEVVLLGCYVAYVVRIWKQLTCANQA